MARMGMKMGAAPKRAAPGKPSGKKKKILKMKKTKKKILKMEKKTGRGELKVVTFQDDDVTPAAPRGGRGGSGCDRF